MIGRAEMPAVIVATREVSWQCASRDQRDSDVSGQNSDIWWLVVFRRQQLQCTVSSGFPGTGDSRGRRE